MHPTSIAPMTASTATLEKSAIFSFTARESAICVRQSSTSGWMPISRISLTECCVGFVLSSPAVGMNGTRVTWIESAFCQPASILSWRMASRNGSDSMSPAVPPISMMATSTPSAASRTRDLIS
jgi:hypothetical protein